MPAPPAEAELVALAERALAGVEHGQATVWWESSSGDPEPGLRVEVLAVRDGRVGVARGECVDGDDLAALAREAWDAARAGSPAPPLPDPATGRSHQGYDPAVLRADPPPARAGVAKTAIASTQGVRAYEQRSFVAVEVGGLQVAAVSLAGVDADGLGADLQRLAAAGVDLQALDADPQSPAATGEEDTAPAGALAAVLGPDAVAAVLDRLRPELGRPGALPAGQRVAAPCISLSDSPRFATTLPRSYDAYGVPRQPVPLIQDGVAHRVVSFATGHATRTGAAEARPEHLVLVGGGAADVDELMAPIEHGVYLPTLERALLVHGGRIAGVLPAGTRFDVDPLAVLAGTQALTSHQRTIPTAGRSARTIGATVCPALRTLRGVARTPTALRSP